MLETNFDKKANQLLTELLAPAALPAVGALTVGAPEVAAVVGANAFLPGALLGLATLGMGKLISSKWAEKNKPLPMTTPAGTQPTDVVLPPLTPGGQGFKVPQKISPTTPATTVPPAAEPEAPAFQPQGGRLTVPQKIPTPTSTKPAVSEPAAQTQQQASTTGVQQKPAELTTQAAAPANSIPLPIPQKTQQPTQSSPAGLPIVPSKKNDSQRVMPPIGKSQQAYPIDYDLVPQAMGQSYRDTSSEAPMDIMRRLFSDKPEVTQNAVPDETNSPEEVAQRFKDWEKESKSNKYKARGAFGGALEKPY